MTPTNEVDSSGSADGSGAAIVARSVGELQVIQAGLMSVSVLVALLFTEWYTAGVFLLSALITGSVGIGARYLFSDTPGPELKHAMVIAGVGWFVTAAFGAVPFYLAAHLLPSDVIASYVPAGADYQSSLLFFRDPIHALFEGMSGWTTTGLTMAVHEPSLPNGLLWWRTLMQWVGGVGVIILTITILRRSSGTTSYALYRSEARERKLKPSMIETMRELWRLYLGVTFAAFIYLLVGLALLTESPLPFTIWNALTHAMTAISTGGFSILDGSISTFESYAVEILFVPVMFAGGIAYPLYYAVFRERDFQIPLRDPQARLFIGLLVIGIPLLTWLNAFKYNLNLAFRYSLFQYVSALSTTGFQAAPIGDWGGGAIVYMVFGAMVVGGMAGATVGGIKILRAYLIGRGILWEVRRVFQPEHAVVGMKLGDEMLDRGEMESEFTQAMTIALVYLLLLTTSLLVLLMVVDSNYEFADILFEVASAQSTVGLSSGITGPTMARTAEIVIILQMWIGRLEIIPVLVTFRALFFGFRS